MSDDGDDGGKLVVLDPSRVMLRDPPKARKPQYETKYSPALGQEVCDVMATADKGLKALCKEHPHWPDYTTIYRWRVSHEDFNRAFVFAQRLRAAMFMDDIVAIVDDASEDTVTVEGRELPNPVAVQRAKIRAEFRERVAKRLDPATWGDKSDLNVNVGYLSQDEAIRFLK